MRLTLAAPCVALLAASAMAANTCLIISRLPGTGITTPGLCVPTRTCTADGGSYYSGWCPNDPPDVKCCLYGDCHVPGVGDGFCAPTSMCLGNGKSYPGYCGGPREVQCCIGGAR
ncbi:hypothetical protein FBU30_008617 [Linnemannia zychae]|nr:hypothetical protein FBU30_008617 [Linnemannia zychae]